MKPRRPLPSASRLCDAGRAVYVAAGGSRLLGRVDTARLTFVHPLVGRGPLCNLHCSLLFATAFIKPPCSELLGLQYVNHACTIYFRPAVGYIPAWPDMGWNFVLPVAGHGRWEFRPSRQNRQTLQESIASSASALGGSCVHPLAAVRDTALAAARRAVLVSAMCWHTIAGGNKPAGPPVLFSHPRPPPVR